MKNLKIIWIQIILIMMKTMMIMINRNQKLVIFSFKSIITKIMINLNLMRFNKLNLRLKNYTVYHLVMLVHFNRMQLVHPLIIHMWCSISILISPKKNLKNFFLIIFWINFARIHQNQINNFKKGYLNIRK
jgi:hypothetical protein